MTPVKLSPANTRTVDALLSAAELIADRGLCPPDHFFQRSRRNGRHTISSAIRSVITGHELMVGTETAAQQETVVRALVLFGRVSGEAAADFGEFPSQTAEDAVHLLRAAAEELTGVATPPAEAGPRAAASELTGVTT